MNNSFIIPSSYIKLLNLPYNKDFTLILNQKKLNITKFYADFLSPIISQIHSSDFEFNEYKFKTNDPLNFVEKFFSYRSEEHTSELQSQPW